MNEKTRRFFHTFSKSATPQRILAEGENSATAQRKFVLSWNHYQILLQQKLREWIAEFKEKENNL